MTVTMADIARAAGVSKGTVSYALSGKRPISQNVRARIDAAIAELGFVSNAGARTLATSRTNVLGLFLQFHDDEYPPAMLEYLRGVSDAAAGVGYDVLVVTDPDGESAVRRVTASAMVDGVVLLDVRYADPRVPVLRAARQPGALVGLPYDVAGVDVFDLDFAACAGLLVDHLADLGHLEIVLLSPPHGVVERGGAYTWRFRDAALVRAAARGVVLHTRIGESRQPAVGANLHATLDELPDATALIVHNDGAIAALPAVLEARGLSTPNDLSVASLFSRSFARTFRLPYTAVDTTPEGLGREAVRHLLGRIEDPGRPAVARLLPPVLIDRGSTGPPRPPTPPSR